LIDRVEARHQVAAQARPIVAMGWQKGPAAQAALAWAPVLGWLLAGNVLFVLARPRAAVAVP